MLAEWDSGTQGVPQQGTQNKVEHWHMWDGGPKKKNLNNLDKNRWQQWKQKGGRKMEVRRTHKKKNIVFKASLSKATRHKVSRRTEGPGKRWKQQKAFSAVWLSKNDWNQRLKIVTPLSVHSITKTRQAFCFVSTQNSSLCQYYKKIK